MDARVSRRSADGPEPSLADLFGGLIGDGKNLVRAEANLYKEIASHRLEKASGGAVVLVLGALLLNTALIVLLVGAALALAIHVGPLLGGLIVAAIAAVNGLLLVRYGLGKLKALAGDAEEKAALGAGKDLA